MEHFAGLTKRLDAAGIKYTINERLVRGLDYYNRTVFEWVTDSLGAQGTVCAGGRYDGLVEQLGGKGTPAVGFALGIERLVLMLTELEKLENIRATTDVYVVMSGEQAEITGVALAEQWRDDVAEIRIQTHCGGGKFNKQMKRADKSGAKIAVILGDSEIENQQATIKYLRENKEQQSVPFAQMAAVLTELI